MKHRIRIIKHRDESSKEPKLDRLERSSLATTREITTTIQQWVSEFKERRRTEEQHSRSRVTVTAASLLLMLCLGGSIQTSGQQLREAFHRVKQSVVIIRTQQKELAPSPQGGMVSANGLGSDLPYEDSSENYSRLLAQLTKLKAGDSIVIKVFRQGQIVKLSVPIIQ
jgi:hypothetical protein